MVEPVKEGGSKLQLSLLEQGSDKMKKFLHWSLLISTTFSWTMKLYKMARNFFTYRITVESDDLIYTDVHLWLIDNMPPTKQRSVILQSGKRDSSGEVKSVYDEGRGEWVDVDRGKTHFLFDGVYEHAIKIDEHKVKVQVVEEEFKAGQRTTAKVVFTCLGMEARVAVVNMLNGLAAKQNSDDKIPCLFMADRYGDWRRRTDIQPRRIDTVILREGVSEKLLADFIDFKSKEKMYDLLNIPFHRGYLFWGAPGCGKTSIALALASEFGWDIYYLSLTDLEKDTNLINMISRVPSGSVLLLEDIDVAHAATERDDDGKGTTLSGLLNSLDGVMTPHGLITIMTTNHKEVLDEALIREGRVDMDIKIDYVDTDQLSRIFKRFTKLDVVVDVPENAKLTSATVVSEIMKNLDHPEQAVKKISKKLEKMKWKKPKENGKSLAT